MPGILTEGLRTREQLDEAERKYRTLVAALPLVTWLYDAGDRSSTRYVSPQSETMLGYTPHPGDRERILGEIERATKSATPIQAEYRLLARDGSVVWIRKEGTTVRGPDGEPLYRQSFLLDIEERKRADEEHDLLLAAEKRRFRAWWNGNADSTFSAMPLRQRLLRSITRARSRGSPSW